MTSREFEAEKGFLQGHARKRSDSCPDKLKIREGLWQSIFKEQVRESVGFMISLNTVLSLADGEAAGWCHRV